MDRWTVVAGDNSCLSPQGFQVNLRRAGGRNGSWSESSAQKIAEEKEFVEIVNVTNELLLHIPFTFVCLIWKIVWKDGKADVVEIRFFFLSFFFFRFRNLSTNFRILDFFLDISSSRELVWTFRAWKLKLVKRVYPQLKILKKGGI